MFANFSIRYPLQQQPPPTYQYPHSPRTPSTDGSSSPSSPPRPSSHARKRGDGHVRRPPNSFLIFRSELCNKHKYDPTGERDHRTLSAIAGMCWKRLSEDQREIYRKRAEVEKKRHAVENPGYKYSPVVRRRERKKPPVKRRLRNNRPADEKERCLEIASSWVKDFEVSPPVEKEAPCAPATSTSEWSVNPDDVYFDFSSPDPFSFMFEPTTLDLSLMPEVMMYPPPPMPEVMIYPPPPMPEVMMYSPPPPPLDFQTFELFGAMGPW